MTRGRAMKARGRSALAKLSVPIVWRYGRDLTEDARRGRLDPVIGREDEFNRLIQILGRKTKNNPVLIGRSGVGKTAIVEGLAQRIAEGGVPPALQGKRLVSLDLASMLAGARIRGEFEERLKSALALIATSKGEFVLLIDELHMIVGTGGGDGGMDVSNMLKPMLARGELRLIGASTPDEYRKHVEKDAALERQFQPVYVEPPSARDTVEILRGLRERHEVFHGVRISDSAIEAAVALSDRYVSGRELPDKAVDLIDEAASRLRIGIESPPSDLGHVTQSARRVEMELIALSRNGGTAPQRDGLERELAALRTQAAAMTAQWRAEQEAISSIRQIKEELAGKRAEAARWERAGDLARAADIAYGQIGDLDRRLNAAAKMLADRQAGGGMLKSEVDTEEVAAVVSAWTGVPVSRLMEGEAVKLIQMEDVIRRRVVGQDEAVQAVSGPIRRSRAGLADGNRPIGTFLFLGPTGVGKTELARALAEFLFDDERAMVRIDMSEYQERHTVSRLIGAPPGYAGFYEGGQLTEAVHRRPYAVVLLDEIEKAHSDVFNTLLQLLDDGRLTDGHGRTVDFTNTVLIMTSNLRQDPKDFFRPEFVNRIDEIVRFRSLAPDDLSQIVGIQLSHLAERAADVGITLEVDQAAGAWLAARGYDPEYGARPLRRVIQRELSDRLAVLLLDGTFQEGDTVHIGMAEDRLNFR
ncbi:MAG TPA: AAA family ATPase [Streptosporangiaceae bacterium]|nr:AAA family ATPase [Streptosporangiaceae bacterium]